MKNLIVIAVFLFMTACKTEKAEPLVEKPKATGCDTISNSILLLKVDYLTQKFEGGKEIKIIKGTMPSDSLPILIDYEEPGDFGNIKLSYEPTGDLIFDGDIIWTGKGEINYPESFNPIGNYTLLTEELQLPDSLRFQRIFNNHINSRYAKIWRAVSKLEKTSCYLKGNQKIGIFLYTPSVGVGNPADWDWFVIMSK